MFKKMSYNKEEDTSIKNLEKRICDLENPYKFDIGDYVKCILFDNTIDFGIVVYQEHDYNNTSLIYIGMLGNYNPEPIYKRKNTYGVYSEQSKKTYYLDESLISLHKQKK